MDNATRIDNIVEDLKTKVALPEAKLEQSLSESQAAIKNFLDERRIHYLVHFTDRKNVESIKSKGILSVEQLDQEQLSYVSNDKSRNDNKLDYISLSVSGMNQFVYKNFRYTRQTIERGVAVVIDARILYEKIDTPRIYCTTNAATSDSKKGDSPEALREMFSDIVEYSTQTGGQKRIDRAAENRNSFEPTDLQAEILWNRCVPVDYNLFYWDLEEDFFYGN